MTISAWAGTISGTVLQSTSSTLGPRSRPANWYSDRVSGTGVTAARMVPGSAPMHGAGGQRLALARRLPAAVVLGAAAVRQPAHDRRVPAQSPACGRCRGCSRPPASCRGPLVTTSGQVISGAGSPGQQVWIGSSAKVDLVARQHHLLHRRRRYGLRPHGHDGLGQRQHLHGLREAAAAVPAAQEGQQLADLAQLGRGSRSMPQATRLTVPNRLTRQGIGARCRRPDDVLEQHRRPAAAPAAASGSRSSPALSRPASDAHQPARAFQPVHEIAQGRIGHGKSISECRGLEPLNIGEHKPTSSG